MKYAVIYETGSGGGYSAYAPDLAGCVAAARTLQQTRELMEQVIESHIEVMRLHGEPVPEPPVLNFTVTRQGHWLLCDVFSTGTHAVPFDAYLHEIADVDLGDPESLRRLVQQLGSFSTYGSPYEDLPCRNKRDWTRQLNLEAVRTGWALPDLEAEGDRLMGETDCIPIHLNEVSLRARVLQRLGRQLLLRVDVDAVLEIGDLRRNRLGAELQEIGAAGQHRVGAHPDQIPAALRRRERLPSPRRRQRLRGSDPEFAPQTSHVLADSPRISASRVLPAYEARGHSMSWRT